MPQDPDGFSRRDFLQTSTAAATANGMGQSSPPLKAHSPFAPASKPRKISDNLFVLEDTCNVYLTRSGSSGLLIDFGSGAMLNYLPDLGVSSIEWILHTHHHRDQAQGDELAISHHIRIAVPVHERQYFQDVESFWRNRRIFDMHYVRNDFFSLTRDILVSAVLKDEATFRWRDYSFFVQPTPGHTPGSITLLATIDGARQEVGSECRRRARKLKWVPLGPRVTFVTSA